MKQTNKWMAALGVASLLVPLSGFEHPCNRAATMFYFNGISPSDYFVAGGSGWVIHTTEPYDESGDQPSLVSHPSIHTPEDLAAALQAATGSTIESRLNAIGANIYSYKVFPE